VRINILREVQLGETRVAIIPDGVARLVKHGADVDVEAGLGQEAGFRDEAYAAVGARVVADRQALLASADLLLRLHKPAAEEVSLLKSGCIHVSFLNPLRPQSSFSN